MLRQIMYSKLVYWFCKCFFGLFYEKDYLKGKYFEEKRLGWLWALQGLRGRVIGRNRRIPWPVGKNTLVSSSKNITFDNSSINVFQMPGCYYQCHKGRIIIGKNVQIAPNCGVITTNHSTQNPDEYLDGKDVIIGDYCWIGMNSVILPGVILGSHTVVGAGSVVTRSFPEGNVVVAGVPAKVIHSIDA